MSLIRKPHELQTTKCIKMLIYGQPGLGKSTLALSAPQPLHLDFDGGVHRVKAQHRANTVQIESWQNVLELLEKEDLAPYKTLIIDTAGKMLDFMSAFIIAGDPKMGRKDGQLALQGFGARKGLFQRFLAQAGMLGKHLVFVAHEKEEKDGDQKVIRPEIGGSSAGDLIKDLDLVGYMEAKGKLRTISFNPCEKFYGKNTCDLEDLIQLPDLEKAKNNLLVSVFDKFAANLAQSNVVMGQYTALLDQVRGKLELVVDAQSANEFTVYAQNAEHIWDSKLQASHLLREKAKELGLTFNGVSKVYEGPKAQAAAAAPAGEPALALTEAVNG